MSNKDMKALRRLAESQGWVVELRKGGHIAFRSPDVEVPVIFSGATPSCKRAIHNLKSQLRRAGLKV